MCCTWHVPLTSPLCVMNLCDVILHVFPCTPSRLTCRLMKTRKSCFQTLHSKEIILILNYSIRQLVSKHCGDFLRQHHIGIRPIFFINSSNQPHVAKDFFRFIFILHTGVVPNQSCRGMISYVASFSLMSLLSLLEDKSDVKLEILMLKLVPSFEKVVKVAQEFTVWKLIVV